MVPPVMLTLGLVVVNIPLRRFAPRYVLTQVELIVFYGMQSVMCAMASEWVDSVHTYIYGYAISDSAYVKDQIVPHLSPLLFFTDDKGALKGFVNGGKTAAFFWANLGPWMPKILAWTVIITLIAGAMLCINALMEKQWAQNERMAFPLVQLPLAIPDGGGDSPFWRDRVMWSALLLMFGIDMLNGLAFLYPQLPTINVRYLGDVSQFSSRAAVERDRVDPDRVVSVHRGNRHFRSDRHAGIAADLFRAPEGGADRCGKYGIRARRLWRRRAQPERPVLQRAVLGRLHRPVRRRRLDRAALPQTPLE